MSAAIPPPPAPPHFSRPSKHWWITNKKVAERHLRRARSLLDTQDANEVNSALNLLDAALELWPRWDRALELKARALLFLKKFKDVATMLQDYIPSLRFRDIYQSDSPPVSREKVHLLPSYGEDRWNGSTLLKCFSVSRLKEKLLSGLSKNREREEWRFLVLGQACCHLGMLEDALLLLQSGKRVACAAFRRRSTGNEDSFQFDNSSLMHTPMESEIINHWLGTIKFLLRKKSAAMAALDAGLYNEAARLFSKILEGRRGTPQGFIAECYMLRATAYQSAGRVMDAIADCNRTLALDPTCIDALNMRAILFERVRCFTECLQDFEHVKLLYESILRHQKYPGPVWKHQNVSYRDISRNLDALNIKILNLKHRLGSPSNIDYYTLMGVGRGCTRADLEKSHLLLCLRHRPDKASYFVERCEFVDERDIDSVKEQARLTSSTLYRLLQKAYTYVMTSVMEEEAARQKQLKADEAKKEVIQVPKVPVSDVELKNKMSTMEANCNLIQLDVPDKRDSDNMVCYGSFDKRDIDGEYQQVLMAVSSKSSWGLTNGSGSRSTPSRIGESIYKSIKEESLIQDASAFQTAYCRDIAAVGTILSHGFPPDSWMNAQGHPLRTLPVTYEALSC